MGAGVAGGLFFLLNLPQGTSITILIPTPTPFISVPTVDVPFSGSQSFSTPQKQRIDINQASAEVLDASLPGIGPVKAKAIVDYRDRYGPFQRIDELMKVPGIGSGIYQEIKDLITVGPTP